jgi:hypothetical protein
MVSEEPTMARMTAAVAIALCATACADPNIPSGDAARRESGPPDTRQIFPDGLPRTDTACAYYSTEAKQTPAAMMIVLDRSSSMTTSNKWTAAVLAIVKAIDATSFDGMFLGLLAYPAFPVASPACLPRWLVPQVSCGLPAVPQVALQDTGVEKTSGSAGPRKEIYKWLSDHAPDSTQTDASPGYDALAAALKAVQAHPVKGKRLVLFITDGGFSCTSVSQPPRPGYPDGFGCPDWEHPDSVIALLKAAHDHASTPVSTFIIGVPGSDSNGQKQGPYDTAPYQMRLALSAYAYAGSPETVDAACGGRTFTKDGVAPSNPCHFDMTKGTFDANALADVIGGIRGKALGCTYELPKVDDKNQVILKDRVNVRLTIEGQPLQIPRRKSATDQCAANPCWDYNAAGEVELLGKACELIKGAKSARVEIVVGCMTVLQ